MDTTVTEKNYPIRLEWVLKFFGLVVLIGLSLIFLSRIRVNLGPGPDPRLLTLLLVIAGVVPVTNALLWRAAFHYSLGSQSLVVRQGILSTQELSIPYGVIWDVTIHRDVFDRLVGLATLRLKVFHGTKMIISRRLVHRCSCGRLRAEWGECMRLFRNRGHHNLAFMGIRCV